MNPVKFRCYRCNQLLGVSRQKVGEVVACPRCLAELVVPDPDEGDPVPAVEETPGTGGPAVSVPTPADPPPPSTPHEVFDSELPPELLNLRPEDIGVEPGVSRTPGTNLPQAPRAATVVTPVPAVAPQPAAEVPAVAETPVPPNGETVSIPPITLDGPSRKSLRESPVSVRSRDLVLPRSVVASWSLFVLLSLGLAFVAGLLAGHYVWRLH